MQTRPRVRDLIACLGKRARGSAGFVDRARPPVAGSCHASTHAQQPRLGGLVTSVTTAGGKYTQQDAALHFALPAVKVAVVADGISSTTAPELAAETAVTTALCSLVGRSRRGHVLTADDLRHAFQATHDRVGWQARAHGIDVNPPGTTLIVGIELPDRFLLGYVGDGAAVYADGALQWMTNLLHPQTGRGGAIAHYIGMPASSVTPVCVEIPKLRDGTGNVLVLGSDGALPLGSVLSTLELLLPEVRQAAMRSVPGAVHQLVEHWIRQRIQTDDNRSLALLVSQEALDCWRSAAGQTAYRDTRIPSTERHA